MKFDPSKGRLVKFSRGGRACFHVHVQNFAPFEIEAKEGIEEVCKYVPLAMLMDNLISGIF